VLPLIRIQHYGPNHYKKVAQSEFADLFSWLTDVANYFPLDFSAVGSVESYFVQFAAEPSFEMIHNKDGVETYSYAIEGFSKFDCDRAIKILLDRCFEDKCSRIREAHKANPTDVEKFADLIGKNEFRSQVEKSMNQKPLLTFQSQLNAITSVGR
jgi:hypothetical protein